MNNLKPKPILILDRISQSYHQGSTHVEVLKEVCLSVHGGQTVALVGSSGSGKSTLLQIAGLLEEPRSGEIYIDCKVATNLTDRQKTALRCQNVGFVYQFHHLLPEFSALENLVIPQMIAGVSQRQAESKARRLLDSFGLAARMSHRPAQLSGGEQQRVAILRAIVNAPQLLLADEPTGNLDENTAKIVLAELLQLVKENQMGALIATHDMNLARQMDQIVQLHQGRIKILSNSSHLSDPSSL